MNKPFQLLLAFACALLLAGCATTSNPITLMWSKIFGRKAVAVQVEEAHTANLESTIIEAAHTEAFKTDLALSAALADHPDELSLTTAKRFSNNALGLLNQVQPLTIQKEQESRDIVAGLLKRVVAAESAQSKLEGDNLGLSNQLRASRDKIRKLQADAASEAAENLKLANQLRTEVALKWAGAAGSCLLGLLALAYKLNIGRFQEGAAQVIASLQKNHGDQAANTARTALDAVLHTGEQQSVAKALFSLTQT